MKKVIKQIYYAGRFHKHRIPAIKLLIDWLKDKDYRLVIRSLGPIEANTEILRYAEEKEVTLTLLQPTDPEIVAMEAKLADILVLFEDLEKQKPNSEATLPGKLMEYLKYEAPILAITRDDSEIGKILEETGRGYAVSTLEELSEKILQPLQWNWDKIKKYSREYQTKELCKILDEVYTSS